MRNLTLLMALILAVAACGGGAGASEPEAESALASTTTASTAVDDHVDDHAVSDEASDDHSDDAVNEEALGDHADDGHDASSAADVDRTVEVAMDEFAFEPSEFEAMGGETIEFVVSNLGVVEHEFRLSNEHRIEEHLAAGHADHDDQAAGEHHEGGDAMLLVEPGETGSITVTFGEDTTLYSEVACLIPGHYEAGMKAPMRLSV
jgi:uncharacterized cupredoxin-like copper-binding protein